jgi:hypothetical protein
LSRSNDAGLLAGAVDVAGVGAVAGAGFRVPAGGGCVPGDVGGVCCFPAGGDGGVCGAEGVCRVQQNMAIVAARPVNNMVISSLQIESPDDLNTEAIAR